MHPQKEVQVDVSRDPNRFIRDRTRPAYLPGTQFTIVVPFEGDATLFDYAPSTFTSVLARGEVDRRSCELKLTYTQVEPNPEEITREYEQDLNLISRYLGWVSQDVNTFNASLDQIVREAIGSRKARLQSAEEAVKGLGIPIRPPR